MGEFSMRTLDQSASISSARITGTVVFEPCPISEAWIDRLNMPVSAFRDGTGYTDHWWLRPLPRSEPGYIISVSGRGGQFLYLVPAYNLLVVFTGENFGDATTEPRLLFDFVMPLIEGLDRD
jgi:CubicO group peptidase (beta-lactamase class C family)